MQSFLGMKMKCTNINMNKFCNLYFSTGISTHNEEYTAAIPPPTTTTITTFKDIVVVY
jgi:hypothetical protein